MSERSIAARASASDGKTHSIATPSRFTSSTVGWNASGAASSPGIATTRFMAGSYTVGPCAPTPFAVPPCSSCIVLSLAAAGARAEKTEHADSVKGFDKKTYTVSAKAGQTLVVWLKSDSSFAFFNVTPWGGEAIWTGSEQGKEKAFTRSSTRAATTRSRCTWPGPKRGGRGRPTTR